MLNDIRKYLRPVRITGPILTLDIARVLFGALKDRITGNE